MEKKIIVEESSGDGCSGFQYPEECPHDEMFDPYSMVCKKCADDLAKAMEEGEDAKIH